jgi:hypothetical protein
MTIRELRILPPLAIARLGSGEPMDNYTAEDDPRYLLNWRVLKPQPTFEIDERRGSIRRRFVPESVEFMTGNRIRPVAPFLEVFAVTEAGALVPLTLKLLARLGLDQKAISWRAVVANRKVVRRTDNPKDLVLADTDWFEGHKPQRLRGHCDNFISKRRFIDFGQVRYIRPTAKFPEIRLRFTPAKGLIYGPNRDEREKKAHDKKDAHHRKDPIPLSRAIYDRTKGWNGFGAADDSASSDTGKPPFLNETMPPSLYAVEPPAPTWLNNNIAISRGYLDDACDGFVEVQMTLRDGRTLGATARICASPPAVVPDAQFVRTLADDLEQVIEGPHLGKERDSVTRARAEDIVRRAYETVRFMNVAVMNGNNFKGRSALLLDSMPEEEAAITQRAIRPVMSPATVDTFTIMALHEQVLAALRGGAAPWFERLMRRPNEVADFTDRGRRKMPALMCGADNNYLALTWRQINIIRKAGQRSIFEPAAAAVTPQHGKLVPRNLTAQVHYEAAGNPLSSRPVTSVANCCPGLEFDFRAVWRRIFKGLVLREWDSLIVDVDGDCPPGKRFLKGHRLLRIHLPGGENDEDGIKVVTEFTGPAASDPRNEVKLTNDMNPAGLAPLEWSNALSRVLEHKGRKLVCEFTRDEAWELADLSEPWKNTVRAEFEVRPFFDDDTAVISRALADAGELTQGLCSPWQNDYRECSCYYWASARPDYVNVETADSGLSKGFNWLQKKRKGEYVPDDYVDPRLVNYDDLFDDWERWVRFQVQGRDRYPDHDDKED